MWMCEAIRQVTDNTEKALLDEKEIRKKLYKTLIL